MKKTNFHAEIRKNKIGSYLVISLFIILIVGLGAVGGAIIGDMYVSIAIATTVAIIYALITFYSGDKMVLRMSGAKEATKPKYTHLINIVEGLAIAAGVPKPKIFIIEDSALNAFATGRSPEHASITVTTGLFDRLNREELEGVVAHEMSHIKNYDIRMMMLTAVMVGAITLFSDILLRTFIWGPRHRNNKMDARVQIFFIVIGVALVILSPIIAQMIKLAVSRKREYLADANGAMLTRYPLGLASALEKISKDPDPLVDSANRATAHLYISTPFRQKSGVFTKMFATHPPIEDRITRLKSM